MVPPLPLPEGMTQDEVNGMRVNEKWRLDERFVCRRCGSLAYLHPYTNHVWGCLTCRFTAASVSVYFRPVRRDS